MGLGEGTQSSLLVGENVGLLKTAVVGLFVGFLVLLRLVGLGVGLLVGAFVGFLVRRRRGVGLGVGLLVG